MTLRFTARRIHLGDVETMRTACGVDVARRHWVDGPGPRFLRYGVSARATHLPPVDANCARCSEATRGHPR